MASRKEVFSFQQHNAIGYPDVPIRKVPEACAPLLFLQPPSPPTPVRAAPLKREMRSFSRGKPPPDQPAGQNHRSRL